VNRRTALAAAALPLVAIALVGCGSTTGTSQTHVMSDGRTMSGSSMSGMDRVNEMKDTTEMSGEQSASGTGADAPGPSEAAAMVCSDEIRTAVAHTLQLPSAPQGLQAWESPRFRCSYLLGAGELRLSVQDLDTAGPGQVFFDGLEARLPHATRLRGVEALGFPSFETTRGDVVFLKDHKTLWVDASRLTASALPTGMSRTDVAYGVAAAVIACWSE
jgi:hypothetical protein